MDDYFTNEESTKGELVCSVDMDSTNVAETAGIFDAKLVVRNEEPGEGCTLEVHSRVGGKGMLLALRARIGKAALRRLMIVLNASLEDILEQEMMGDDGDDE